MSTAFDHEPDQEDSIEDLLDRPTSQHPNFVTAEGLAQIELELARRQEALDAAQAAGDRPALDRIARELSYWVARRATAQVVDDPQDTSRVRFGCTVTIRSDQDGRRTWRIVGEDEATPDHGSLSYAAPLAQALVGRKAGDVVRLGEAEIEVVSIG